MQNKTLVVLVILLAAVVVIEGGYLISMRQHQWVEGVFMPYRHMPLMRGLDREGRNFEKFEKWDPMEDMESMQQQINSMFDNSFARAFKREKTEAKALFEPKISVQETKTEYIVEADLPGMNKEDINVEISNHFLTISGERKSEKETENKKVFREDQNFGYFSRTITLPNDVKTTDITSKYMNGVLTISMPRMEAVKGAEGSGRKILIK